MECASSLTLCCAADPRLQRLLAYSCGTCGSVPLRSATHCFWAVLGVVLCVLILAVLPSAYIWPGCGLVVLWGTVSAVCMTARPLRAAAVVPAGDCAGALTCTCLFSGSATVLLALARCSGKVAVPLLTCSGFGILITRVDVPLHLVSDTLEVEFLRLQECMRPSADPRGSLFAGVWRFSRRARPATATCCAEAARCLARYGLWSEGLTLWMGLGDMCCGTGVGKCAVGPLNASIMKMGTMRRRCLWFLSAMCILCCVCGLDRKVFVM